MKKMKQFISLCLLVFIISMTFVPFSAKAEPLILNIPAPVVDQLYIGDDYITGTLQQEIPMHYPGNGAFVFLNNRQYNIFDYTVENDTYFRLKLPKTLEAGDTLNYFAITGNVLDPIAYPGQESYKMAGPFTPIEKAKIQVNYLDEANQPLVNSETLTGKLGESYTTSPKAIQGYQLKTTPANATGAFTTNTDVIEVNYLYEKIPAQGENITVQYIDETTNQEIAETETLSGELGEQYQSEAKIIDGYELSETPENQSGTFTNDAQTVIYKYTKIAAPNVAQAVTVNYKDTEGKELTKPIILTGSLGETFETETKTFTGYTLTKLPANKNGTFTTDIQVVNYLYTKNEDSNTTTPDKDKQLTPAVAPNNTLKPEEQTKRIAEKAIQATKQSITKRIAKKPVQTTNQSITKAESSLPATGDSNSKFPLIIGSLLILGTGYFFISRKKAK